LRDPKERVRDILDAIHAIERYADRTRAAFDDDELLQNWFLRHLQTVGEAARALPDDVRARAPQTPWTEIIGMRNILVHGYFNIDRDIVWNTAVRDVPALKPTLERLLRELEEEAP
jgi:uncharacterized protein with HEPN domain